MWLSTENGLLTEGEKQYLDEIISDFETNRVPGPINAYNQHVLPSDTKELSGLLETLKQTILGTDTINKDVVLLEMFVNYVQPETNKNDPLHEDLARFSTITFLNDDYEGGDLEVEYKNIKRIEPEAGKTVIIEGSKIKHRVLPVSKGHRFTFVTFWEVIHKTQQTLM